MKTVVGAANPDIKLDYLAMTLLAVLEKMRIYVKKITLANGAGGGGAEAVGAQKEAPRSLTCERAGRLSVGGSDAGPGGLSSGRRSA